MFKDSKILITGGTGMVGRALIDILKTYNPKELISVSMDDSTIEGVTCLKRDLRFLNEAIELCEGVDYIFHLAGIKGSPKMCAENPYSFSVPMIQFNANMVEGFKRSKAKAMLVTSSVGVYAPADIFYEDDVWKTFPSDNDRFAGWAKRILELNVEAYNKQFGGRPISIIRPANIYGYFDNFNPETAMVIPSLIARICSGESPLTVWGDGTAIRDFVHASDVARAMVFAVENGIIEPINVGSGEGVLIKDIVDSVVLSYEKITGKKVNVTWDITKPTGDAVRKMDMTRANGYGFYARKNLKEGIHEAMLWHLEHKDVKRYDVFKDNK